MDVFVRLAVEQARVAMQFRTAVLLQHDNIRCSSVVGLQSIARYKSNSTEVAAFSCNNQGLPHATTCTVMMSELIPWNTTRHSAAMHDT